MIYDPSKRHDFVLLFELKNADLGGVYDLPPEGSSGEVKYGLVTDGAFKRLISAGAARQYDLPVLIGSRGQVKSHLLRPLVRSSDSHNPLKLELCRYFFDVRLFGLTGATHIPAPMQLSSARSVDPVLPQPPQTTAWYGLYRLQGSYDPHRGQHTGVTAFDLEVFWKTLTGLFKSNPKLLPLQMAARGLWVFSQNPQNRATGPLLEQVQPSKISDLPQSFGDYTLRYPKPGPLEANPEVTLTHWA